MINLLENRNTVAILAQVVSVIAIRFLASSSFSTGEMDIVFCKTEETRTAEESDQVRYFLRLVSNPDPVAAVNKIVRWLGVDNVDLFALWKNCYRKAAMIYHPDRNPTGEDIMKSFNSVNDRINHLRETHVPPPPVAPHSGTQRGSSTESPGPHAAPQQASSTGSQTGYQEETGARIFVPIPPRLIPEQCDAWTVDMQRKYFQAGWNLDAYRIQIWNQRPVNDGWEITCKGWVGSMRCGKLALCCRTGSGKGMPYCSSCWNK